MLCQATALSSITVDRNDLDKFARFCVIFTRLLDRNIWPSTLRYVWLTFALPVAITTQVFRELGTRIQCNSVLKEARRDAFGKDASAFLQKPRARARF